MTLTPFALAALVIPAVFALQAYRLATSGRRYRRLQHGIYWT